MDRAPIWPYALSLMLLAALTVTFFWLGYACTADTPPDCPLDPGYEWGRDFSPMQPAQASTPPVPPLPGN